MKYEHKSGGRVISQAEYNKLTPQMKAQYQPFKNGPTDKRGIYNSIKDDANVISGGIIVGDGLNTGIIGGLDMDMTTPF